MSCKNTEAKYMYRDMSSDIYFHCSQNIRGNVVGLTPRGSGPNRGEGEPDILRTCVCSRISHCLAAALFSANKTIRVYAAIAYAWTPYDVIDSELTKEKWILEYSIFRKVAEIPKQVAAKLYYCDGIATKENINKNYEILKKEYIAKNLKIIKNPIISDMENYL